MAAPDPARIRDLALIGHGGAGKTTLAEALLFAAGVTGAPGRLAEGTSHFDTEAEERRRGGSIFTAFHHLSFAEGEINLIDTPGASAFVRDASTALLAATSALLVVPATGTTRAEDERLMAWAAGEDLPRVTFVTRMDDERADFGQAIERLAVALDIKIVPIQIPVGSGAGLAGVVDLASRRAWLGRGAQAREADPPVELAEAIAQARDRLVEAVAETDDLLLEHYLDAGELTAEDLERGLRAAVARGALVPALCGSGETGVGVRALLEFIATRLPSAAERPVLLAADPRTGDSALRAPSVAAPFCAQIVRTLVDPFAGKLSVFRVLSGQTAGDTTVLNTSRGVREKFGHLFRLEGPSQVQVALAVAGDVVAVAKLKESITGDTLADEKEPAVLPRPRGFEPAISFSIEPRTRGEEDKVMQGLQRLHEEDPALHIDRDAQTKEILLGGASQLHVETAIERLARKFNVGVKLAAPKVPYRETIRVSAKAEGKVKKQTGGHGQFALVHLEVEPNARGAGFEFIDRIVGGSVPRNFIPAVEKGLIEALGVGTLAGFPVVDVKAALTDGKHHDVDSSEMAFKLAAGQGFRAACELARPVVLEPIMALEISVPEDCMGDVIGDLNARRGRVSGVESRGHHQVIRAQVPMAEILIYSPDLDSRTAGRGSFHVEFSHYDELPAHLLDKVRAAGRRAEGA